MDGHDPNPGTSVWTRYAVVAEEGLADVQSLLAFHASGSELIKVQQANPTKCGCSMNYVVLPSLKLTASLHLKNGGWKLEDKNFLLGPGLSPGAVAMLVSGRVSPDDYHFPSQITIQFFFLGDNELLPFIFGVEKGIPLFFQRTNGRDRKRPFQVPNHHV